MKPNKDQDFRTGSPIHLALASLDRVLELVDDSNELRAERGARFSLALHVSPPTPGGFRALDPAPPELLMRVQTGGALDGIVEDATIARLGEVLGEAAPWLDSLPDASGLSLEVRATGNEEPLARVVGSTRGGFLEATEVEPAALGERLARLPGD
jgi:hypothetical protein